MRLTVLIISVLFSTISFSQKNETIDSIFENTPGFENYRYWYGGNEHSICDFRMDTTTGKLSRFRYTSEGVDTIRIDYFFINNYLVKAHSFKFKDGRNFSIGTYYFRDNKIIHKTGRNLTLERTGVFKKIAPKYFNNQLDYIYFQYEYLNPSKTRYQVNVPELLEQKRQEIDKRNSYYN